MLGLDDPRWGELDHAYGKANDIPALLEALRACELLPGRWQDEPLSSLWQSLCHQGDACSAAQAALPHLVDILSGRPAREGETVMHLVGAIVASAHRGPQVIGCLSDAYNSARARAAEVIHAWLAQGPVDHRTAFVLLTDHASVSGENLLARALMALEPGEVDFVCTGCSYRGMFGMGDDGIEIDPIEWARRAPASGEGNTNPVYHKWAVDLGQSALARQIADFDSTFLCPECGRELRLVDAIVAAYP